MSKWPREGYRSPYDIGWEHGTDDINFPFKYRYQQLPFHLNINEIEEYKAGYRDARRNWD